jgi:hypothetical protein
MILLICVHSLTSIVYIIFTHLLPFPLAPLLTLLGLERCAGEVVTDMLTIIETCDPDEAQMRLVMRGDKWNMDRQTFCAEKQELFYSHNDSQQNKLKPTFFKKENR